MAFRKLLVSTAVGATLALSAMAAPAQAAPTSELGIRSCPAGAPPALDGFRCLSPYPTLEKCEKGTREHVDATPATDSYCFRPEGSSTWWGYVNRY